MADGFMRDESLVGAHGEFDPPDQLMAEDSAQAADQPMGYNDNQLVENLLALADGGEAVPGFNPADPAMQMEEGQTDGQEYERQQEPALAQETPQQQEPSIIEFPEAQTDLEPTIDQSAVETQAEAAVEMLADAQAETQAETQDGDKADEDAHVEEAAPAQVLAETSQEASEPPTQVPDAIVASSETVTNGSENICVERADDGSETSQPETTREGPRVVTPEQTDVGNELTDESATTYSQETASTVVEASQDTSQDISFQDTSENDGGSGGDQTAKDLEKPEVVEVKSSAPSTKSGGSGTKSSRGLQTCIVCKKVCKCKYNIVRNGDIKHLCGEDCFKAFRGSPAKYLTAQTQQTCGYCLSTMDTPTRKLCVDRQDIYFCKMSCMEGFESTNTCFRCKKLFKVGFKGSYCSESCHSSDPANSQKPQSGKCSVCQKVAPMTHQATFNRASFSFCGDFCMSAFIKANPKAQVTRIGCDQCGKVCQRDDRFSQIYEGKRKTFCGASCRLVFKSIHNRMVQCSWCKSKKESSEMLAQEDDGRLLFCTLNCLSLYRVNKQATSTMSVQCDHCNLISPAQYHLTMSDASVRNFCSYNCVMAFQQQFSTPKRGGAAQGKGGASKQATPSTGTPIGSSRAGRGRGAKKDDGVVPQISQVVSLAEGGDGDKKTANHTPGRGGRQMTSPSPAGAAVGPGAQGGATPVVIVKPQEPTIVRNKATMCKPLTMTKATSCRPHTQSKACQTDEDLERKKPTIIPIPVPIYVPVPLPMYSLPVPHPMSMPVPVPVPFFIPTTRKSADGILRHIQKLRDTLPADPFEAEMLMMAEAVAGDGKESESEDSDVDGGEGPGDIVQPDEDVLSMALRMAGEMPGNADFENAINPTTIDPSEVPAEAPSLVHDTLPIVDDIDSPRRQTRTKRSRESGGRGRTKKIKTEEQEAQQQQQQYQQVYVPPVPPPQPEVPADQNMVLKFTYGVNAWKHWVTIKNIDIEKGVGGVSRRKLIKLDLLACSPDELNLALSMFVKEVRKPNGEEYAPDSIFYLCLGIQEYLFENSRVDNIFTDVFYENFNRCLNEVLQNYEVRLNAQGLIVCRIEEEHLWESKQLGAHSPYVLLNTLVYFNTKYFLLRTPEEHLRLSFSHIMKHWKKTGKVGGRSVYLRFYAPQITQDPSQRGRRREDLPVYEQGENLDNPLRCPVKLYEFYLSKCPESIKNRNDVFYLTPERSCVPDSPVWYSTQNLSYESMARMLNRLRVVKEIQEAHLQVQPHPYLG